MKHIRSRTLEQIDGERWGEPPDDATGLMRTVYGLRRTPVGEFDTEELRVLLNQRVHPEVLAEGRYQPGDLLMAVLRQADEFWQRNPGLAERLDRVVSAVEAKDREAEALRTGIEKYRAARRSG